MKSPKSEQLSHKSSHKPIDPIWRRNVNGWKATQKVTSKMAMHYKHSQDTHHPERRGLNKCKLLLYSTPIESEYWEPTWGEETMILRCLPMFKASNTSMQLAGDMASVSVQDASAMLKQNVDVDANHFGPRWKTIKFAVNPFKCSQTLQIQTRHQTTQGHSSLSLAGTESDCCSTWTRNSTELHSMIANTLDLESN